MNNLSVQKAIAAVRTLEKLGYTYHDGELWKPPLGANPSPLLTRITQLQAEVEALRMDSARLDWIIDNASSAGGGNGFTLKVFIPVDCECVRTAIDTAIAKDTQALPEPVETAEESNASWPAIDAPIPHAALHAEYIRQRDVVPCELRFYKWERKDKGMADFAKLGVPPAFFPFHEYRCTDISCYVSKDGDTAIRMLIEDAEALYDETESTAAWFCEDTTTCVNKGELLQKRIYTYRTKATIKLDGNMVTPEQAAAERESKKETHDRFVRWETTDYFLDLSNDINFVPHKNEKFEYELRPKQPTWTGSREDVIALLKEKELIK